MSQELTADIDLFDEFLDVVVCTFEGHDTYELINELRSDCEAATATTAPIAKSRAAQRIRDLSLDQIAAVIRASTSLFHLHNQAEKLEIIRINRRREREATAGRPRTESISEAIHLFKSAGIDCQQLVELFSRIDIQPTLTAHPTEARRRAILLKQTRIALLMQRMRNPDLTPAERRRTQSEIYQLILLMYATQEVRSERLKVIKEVQNGIHFLVNSIWKTVPLLYRDLSESIIQVYQEQPDLPIFLRYRSWIGGDRDGNPGVTPHITRRTLNVMRRTALRKHCRSLQSMRRILSVSKNLIGDTADLTSSNAADAKRGVVAPSEITRLEHEPFRQKLEFMIARLNAARRTGAGYEAHEFVDDLRLLIHSLEAAGLTEVAREGRLADLLVQARTFGFHLAALDIRQHSDVHETAVAELFRTAGISPDYSTMPENRRVELLEKTLASPGPLVSGDTPLSDSSRQALKVLSIMQDARKRDPNSIGSYVISMTHDVSDVLEVLVLMKETGNWYSEGGRFGGDFDIVPLLETIEDLEKGAERMAALLGNRLYRAHLNGRGDFQEIMLGYSDSNKDGGYFMSNWALQKAQSTLARVCLDAGIEFRFFHGRGGTVGRGGGRANRAILSSPSESRNGRIRFTEQGEVISFRYALPAITRRHLEQIIHAVALSAAGVQPDRVDIRPAPADSADTLVPFDHHQIEPLMGQLAEASMQKYRELIDDPGFWPWYISISPIEQISGLPIASRPVSRTAGRADFENLRAIPWVFAWTQMRYNVPGWYGLGTVLAGYSASSGEGIDSLRRMYTCWPFFQTLIDNAQQEMARARLRIAAHYAASGSGDFHTRISEEFDRTRSLILAITGQAELLDNLPPIQASIRARNRWTDVLNIIQVELLDRKRNDCEADRERLQSLLYAGVNAIAAAMQSTG